MSAESDADRLFELIVGGAVRFGQAQGATGLSDPGRRVGAAVHQERLADEPVWRRRDPAAIPWAPTPAGRHEPGRLRGVDGTAAERAGCLRHPPDVSLSP